MDLEKISRAFKRNRFACSVFSCKEDAASYLVRSISGKTVGMGDSVTLAVMGLYEKLQENNTVWDVAHLEGIDESDFSSPARNKKFLETARKCLTTDMFLTSVNAASERHGKPYCRFSFRPRKSIFCVRCQQNSTLTGGSRCTGQKCSCSPKCRTSPLQMRLQRPRRRPLL